MGWTTPKIQTWSFSTVDFVTVFGFSASHMHQWFWVCGSFFFRKINVCQIRCIYFKLPQKTSKILQIQVNKLSLHVSTVAAPHLKIMYTSLEVLVSSLPTSPWEISSSNHQFQEGELLVSAKLRMFASFFSGKSWHTFLPFGSTPCLCPKFFEVGSVNRFCSPKVLSVWFFGGPRKVHPRPEWLTTASSQFFIPVAVRDFFGEIIILFIHSC